jgi:hypothetical protein
VLEYDETMRYAISLIVLMLVISHVTAQDPVAFRFAAVSEASLGLFEGERPVLVYNHGQVRPPEGASGQPRACYLHPVYGLDGEVLSGDFAKDHTYHRGLYTAWPHIKIGEREFETWTARGELAQRFNRWLAKDTEAGRAKLGIENGWYVGEKEVVREEVWATVHPAAKDSRAIDLEFTWTPLDEPLTLRGAEGKSYGGLNFRFGPRTKTTITVPENAQLPKGVRADAGRASDDLVVTRLAWADFVGDFAKGPAGEMAQPSGAAIFVHPGHADYPPTWMARHYGLLSVGWPGVEAQTIPPGKTITCRYRLWIHRGQPAASAIEQEYDEYAKAMRMTP